MPPDTLIFFNRRINEQVVTVGSPNNIEVPIPAGLWRSLTVAARNTSAVRNLIWANINDRTSNDSIIEIGEKQQLIRDVKIRVGQTEFARVESTMFVKINFEDSEATDIVNIEVWGAYWRLP